ETAGVRPRPQPMGRVPKSPSTPLINWTPFKARAAIVLGVVCLLGGIAMSVFMIGVHQHEVDQAKGRTKATAVAVADSTNHVVITFETADGKTITTNPPHRINPGVLSPGDAITIRYLRSNPKNVISDESHFARDFTLWF